MDIASSVAMEDEPIWKSVCSDRTRYRKKKNLTEKKFQILIKKTFLGNDVFQEEHQFLIVFFYKLQSPNYLSTITPSTLQIKI